MEFDSLTSVVSTNAESAAATLGKTAGKDAAHGKPIDPAFFGLDRSKALATQCLTNARAALDSARLLDSRLADIVAGW